jgi:hypothetical protein
MIITRPQALGAHAFFAAEGSAFANNADGGGAGTVDVNDAPASNDPAFLPIGTIEDWTFKPAAKTVKTMTPAPSILVPKRTVTVSQEMAYNLTTNEVTPIALQLFFRAAQTLAQASGQFNPLSGKPLHGFLLLQMFSTEGDQQGPYLVGLIWVFGTVTGGIAGGDSKILKPTWEFDQMYSPLNSFGTDQAN